MMHKFLSFHELSHYHGFEWTIRRIGRILSTVNKLQSFKEKIDTFQRSHLVLAFPIAVFKRYGDENAGKQAALLTYYAFLSLFPLLMIFITILGIIAANNPELESEILQTTYQLFPSLGEELSKNVQTLQLGGLALVLQSLVVLYGAHGVASILQETFNNLWHIDEKDRPGFLADTLRSAAMMLSVGLGMILGVVISFTLGNILDLGWVGTALVTLANLAVTYILFLLVFRLGTAASVNLRKLMLGAAIATVGIIIVQRLGGYIMTQQLEKLQGSYGAFALALGLLFWIYLQAQILLYAIVITIVRTKRDYPKKLF